MRHKNVKVPDGMSWDDTYVLLAMNQYDGKFGGSIMLIRTEDDTSWGEVRQAWLWAVVDSQGQTLGRSTDSFRDTIKSGVDSDPHPLEIFCSLLHFMAAAAEGGENADLFPQEVIEWYSQNDSELSMIDLDLTTELEAPYGSCTTCESPFRPGQAIRIITEAALMSDGEIEHGDTDQYHAHCVQIRKA